MKTLTQKEINIMIENHKHWMARDCEGWESMQADFSNIDLMDINLRNANLAYACFKGADLGCADLSYANFAHANLINVSLRDANLTSVNLVGANLDGASLNHANLINASLGNASLRNANLCNANLKGVTLGGADFRNANLCGTIDIPYIPMACPEKGSFIGYKKAHVMDESDLAYMTHAKSVIVELEICEDARRSSATGRKCRCDKAKVISISTPSGSRMFDFAYSNYNGSFVYRVGEIVEEPNFCEDRFEECAAGIHFFIGRQEAVDY